MCERERDLILLYTLQRFPVSVKGGGLSYSVLKIIYIIRNIHANYNKDIPMDVCTKNYNKYDFLTFVFCILYNTDVKISYNSACF